MESAIARFSDYLQERIDTEVKREVKKAFDNTMSKVLLNHYRLWKIDHFH